MPKIIKHRPVFIVNIYSDGAGDFGHCNDICHGVLETLRSQGETIKDAKIVIFSRHPDEWLKRAQQEIDSSEFKGLITFLSYDSAKLEGVDCQTFIEGTEEKEKHEEFREALAAATSIYVTSTTIDYSSSALVGSQNSFVDYMSKHCVRPIEIYEHGGPGRAANATKEDEFLYCLGLTEKQSGLLVRDLDSKPDRKSPGELLLGIKDEAFLDKIKASGITTTQDAEEYLNDHLIASIYLGTLQRDMLPFLMRGIAISQAAEGKQVVIFVNVKQEKLSPQVIEMINSLPELKNITIVYGHFLPTDDYRAFQQLSTIKVCSGDKTLEAAVETQDAFPPVYVAPEWKQRKVLEPLKNIAGPRYKEVLELVNTGFDALDATSPIVDDEVYDLNSHTFKLMSSAQDELGEREIGFYIQDGNVFAKRLGELGTELPKNDPVCDIIKQAEQELSEQDVILIQSNEFLRSYLTMGISYFDRAQLIMRSDQLAAMFTPELKHEWQELRRQIIDRSFYLHIPEIIQQTEQEYLDRHPAATRDAQTPHSSKIQPPPMHTARGMHHPHGDSADILSELGGPLSSPPEDLASKLDEDEGKQSSAPQKRVENKDPAQQRAIESSSSRQEQLEQGQEEQEKDEP